MRKANLSGSVTIEATLALMVFIFGYLALLALTFAVRTESAVQCALDRTAAQISQYCYAADRLSVSEYIEQAGITASETLELIEGLSDISRLNGPDDESAGFLNDLVSAFSDGSVLSGVLCEPVFRAMLSENLAGSREQSDEYLMSLAGITCNDIDLHYSEVLKDGKTVEMVAVYKVRLHSFGLPVSKGLAITMKNTAVTSAWVNRTAANTEYVRSKWRLSSFERGKAWVAEIKSEHSMDAVKGGKGIDIYKLGKYTMICSMNIFAQTYSECRVFGSSNASDYSVNKDAVMKAVGGYSSKLLECIETKATSLQFENGIHVPDAGENRKAELIIVLPEEAGNTESIRTVLDDIAESIKKNNGVEVVYEYRERALY